jgi:hypothetical protein
VKGVCEELFGLVTELEQATGLRVRRDATRWALVPDGLGDAVEWEARWETPATTDPIADLRRLGELVAREALLEHAEDGEA